MRLFITVNMSARVKEEIASVLPSIQLTIPTGKWVAKENWHVTMLFLGEVAAENLALLETAMMKAVKGLMPFQLQIEGLGVFPNERRPNILWAGVNGDLDTLHKLYQQLLQAVAETGLPFDAKPRYTPHLTLARKIAAGIKAETVKPKSTPWQVDAIELYQSISEANGVRYEKVLTKKFTIEE